MNYLYPLELSMKPSALNKEFSENVCDKDLSSTDKYSENNHAEPFDIYLKFHCCKIVFIVLLMYCKMGIFCKVNVW